MFPEICGFKYKCCFNPHKMFESVFQLLVG
jgi:hypothetical protein